MEKISKLQKIMVEASNEIYMKPDKDFPLDEPRWFKIVDGKYIKTLFINSKPVCSSNDCITGRRNDGSKRQCDGCEDAETCTTACRIYMKNLIPGNIYILNIPHIAQVALSQYVDRLLINDTDAPFVYTQITRAKSGKYFTYKFELGCGDFSTEELNIIMPIVKTYASLSDDDAEEFDVAAILKVSGIQDARISDILNLIKV